MAKCDGCGADVPQDDIDAGVAFSDGENTYCSVCVKKLISELGRLSRRAETETTKSAPVVKPPSRKRVGVLLLLLTVSAFAAAFFLAYHLLFRR